MAVPSDIVIPFPVASTMQAGFPNIEAVSRQLHRITVAQIETALSGHAELVVNADSVSAIQGNNNLMDTIEARLGTDEEQPLDREWYYSLGRQVDFLSRQMGAYVPR